MSRATLYSRSTPQTPWLLCSHWSSSDRHLAMSSTVVSDQAPFALRRQVAPRPEEGVQSALATLRKPGFCGKTSDTSQCCKLQATKALKHCDGPTKDTSSIVALSGSAFSEEMHYQKRSAKSDIAHETTHSPLRHAFRICSRTTERACALGTPT